jgi:hypothetical protein
MISLLILALTASAQAQRPFEPVYGCTWVPEFTAITNFTFTRSANDSAPAYIQWQAPGLPIACNATTTIPKPSTRANVACKQADSGAYYLLSTDETSGTNVTLGFTFYAQCAASIFAFYYEAVVSLSCESDTDGITACGAPSNTTARVWTYQYLSVVIRIRPRREAETD